MGYREKSEETGGKSMLAKTVAKRQIAHEPRRIQVPKKIVPCTKCGSHFTGAIGNKRFFCAECCHEFTIGESNLLFVLTVEGTAIRIAG